MFCPNCGTEVEDDAMFCTWCGTLVKSSEPDPVAEPIPEPQVSYAAQQLDTEPSPTPESQVDSQEQPAVIKPEPYQLRPVEEPLPQFTNPTIPVVPTPTNLNDSKPVAPSDGDKAKSGSTGLPVSPTVLIVGAIALIAIIALIVVLFVLKPGDQSQSNDQPQAVSQSQSSASQAPTITTSADTVSAQKGITVKSVEYAEHNGVAMLKVTCSGFSASTDTQTIGTISSDKRPAIDAYGECTSSNYAWARITTDGKIQVSWSKEISSKTNYTFQFTYLLA